ncbi:MAG: hypothetical protein JW941_10875 [Candidatus Coatesbacteria bacterium]|nr:hypothetical protein [Candidatus Coatesbacteria bacterium]
MTAAGAHELYAIAPVFIWVEDALTEAYLNKLWGDIEIHVAVAGCGETVQAATRDARQAGFPHVFGVRDRDFGKSNFTKWPKSDEAIEVFRLRRHETENYLLDWTALAECSEARLHRSAKDIEMHVKEHAASLDWWLATKWTLFELSADLSKGFPSGPGLTTIKDDGGALSYILASNWYRGVCKLPKASFDSAKIEAVLAKHHRGIEKSLGNADWIGLFPGKELLRIARAFIGKTKGKGQSKVDADIDLAKAIAERQVKGGEKPEDFMLIRNRIRQGVFGGRQPAP